MINNIKKSNTYDKYATISRYKLLHPPQLLSHGTLLDRLLHRLGLVVRLGLALDNNLLAPDLLQPTLPDRLHLGLPLLLRLGLGHIASDTKS